MSTDKILKDSKWNIQMWIQKSLAQMFVYIYLLAFPVKVPFFYFYTKSFVLEYPSLFFKMLTAKISSIF